MHGRKKTGVEPTAEEKAAISTKVDTYQKLASKLLGARAAVASDPATASAQLAADVSVMMVAVPCRCDQPPMQYFGLMYPVTS